MHSSLGVPWPCKVAAEFWALWPNVIKELESKGIRPGPESFQWWNDGDAGLVRAAWCLTRHTKPKKIVETGVLMGSPRALFWRRLRQMEKDISGALTFNQLTHIGARKWVSQLDLAMQIDGHTFRVRAGDGFPGCYPD